MFGHISRLVKHSVVYGLAETISRGTGFILVFIYVHVLSQADIGIRTAVYSAGAVLGVFYTMGLDNAFLRYFMDDRYRDRRKAIFSTSVFFSISIGLCLLCVAWPNAETVSSLMTKSGGYAYITRLLFVILLFDALVLYPMQILRAENRSGYYVLVSFSRFVLFIGLNLVFVWWLGRGVAGIFEANVLVVLVVALLLLPVYRSYLAPEPAWDVLKTLLVFGVPTIFTILAMRVIDLSDRYLILYLLPGGAKAALGRYAVAYTLGMVGIMVFVNSFRLAWQPFFLELRTAVDAAPIFARITSYYTLFIGFVLLGIYLFRELILTLYAPSYNPALAGIIPIISFAYVFFGFYIILMAGVFIREKTTYLPLAAFSGAAVNVGLNLFFIPRFGIVGAAWSTVAAYVVMVVILFAVTRKIYRITYEYRRMGGILLLFGAAFAVTGAWEPRRLLWRELYHAAVFLATCAAAWISPCLTDGERTAVRQLPARITKLWR